MYYAEMTYDDYPEALELVELIQARACALLAASGRGFPDSDGLARHDVKDGMLHLSWRNPYEDWGEEAASVPLAFLLLGNEEFDALLEAKDAERKEASAKYAAAQKAAAEHRERALYEQLKRKFEPEDEPR